jgi:lipopolysaccharide biosynthesis protein
MQEPSIPRLIAFYLPQFHPIPENDEWWGRGFTEWTNAAKAKPRFPGHYQPHVPADLGFYDLRLPEAREAQVTMAKDYGLEGFCYYHYWFGGGRRILERPLEAVLSSGKPDFPFCLCWANETWTGVWHGEPNRVLIEQTYPGPEDYADHFDCVLPALRDSRYMRVDGKPLFLIYKAEDLPDGPAMLELWRNRAREAGLPGLHFVAIEWGLGDEPIPPGFDARVIYKLPRRVRWFPWTKPVRKLFAHVGRRIGLPSVYRYGAVIDSLLPDELPDDKTYPCVIPNWDNTPRSGSNGLVLHESTPELFRQHLRKALRLANRLRGDNRIVFIKSWNEWAEGNHLEPDLKDGRSYLEVVAEELRRKHPSS